MEGNKIYCLVITVVIRNAFSLANCVIATLQKRRVPPYPINVLASYFNGSKVRYDQRSVLSPTLCNVIFGDILKPPPWVSLTS